ncbi:arabinosylfuranosidase ArfA [Microbacterium sp. SLBN-154]|uniref:arabinosylfuranosidase ArfA n=1 Tax=Microbacterium sp. SLBN-154 TaxID=2768458 RepID=UPI001154318A|nr:alpha-N-arabinofuranosidase [Microbacterium sp. SLBN-154]
MQRAEVAGDLSGRDERLRVRVALDSERVVGDIDRRLFGGFVEHMGRGVYGGIYAPGHPSADERGFRRDVIELVRELGVTTVRYPGGNFVSGFHWEDSVGPRELRPTRLNLAWHSSETNEVGVHEFAEWLAEVDAELMLAVNLGTRGTREAIEFLEYVNISAPTRLSQWRSENGRTEPFGVKMWCLGNEMDGPWQLGQRTPEDYGILAAQTAKAMRQVDPDLELVACGSSHAAMPTFGEWEKVVLTHTYDDVDYLSCHAYYEPEPGDRASFLGSAVNMDRFIDAVVATADHVKAVRGSTKTIAVSFDEWNVWYSSRLPEQLPRAADDWPLAPPLSEEDYTVTDGVVVGDLLMSLLRHADRVRSASLAQIVNVIAPIAAPDDGPAWRKATFHPFALTARHARGRSLDVVIDTPGHHTRVHGDTPYVSVAATHDPGRGGAVFLVNRHESAAAEVTVELSGALAVLGVAEAVTLHDPDLDAHNSAAFPDRVGPRPNRSLRQQPGALTVSLPPVSWTMVRLVDVEADAEAEVEANEG